MSLKFTDEPPNGRDSIERRLNAYAHRSRLPLRKYRSKEGSNVYLPPRPYLKRTDGVYAPHPIYFLGLKDLIEGGAGFIAAKPSGFYYVLENNKGEPVARAHMRTDKEGNWVVANLSFGNTSQLTLPALEKLANHTLVQKSDYEVRFIRCIAVNFAAIWLKASEFNYDLIHPLGSEYSIPGSEPPYLAESFMAEFLKPKAHLFRDSYVAFSASRRFNNEPLVP